jgi:acyl phosphate:glycerol-3-phosphate acyltransferase
MALIIILIFTYIAGSVNFSIVLFRLLGKDDPRTRFSGNAGATNVYRQAGKFWAAVVLFLDMGRAILISYIGLKTLHTEYITLPGLVLILGNRFPCFHGFKGGKGVANYLGYTILLSPVSVCIGALAWISIFLQFRKPFLSSFAMVLILGAGTILTYKNHFLVIVFTCLTILFIIINHKQNILEWIEAKKQ